MSEVWWVRLLPTKFIFRGNIRTFTNGNNNHLCSPTHREESRSWLAGLLAGFGVGWVSAPCCDPLSLLLVNDGRLMATKLGQSLRSPGSQRKKRSLTRTLTTMCLFARTQTILTDWGAEKHTEQRDVLCAGRRKKQYCEATVVLAALWGVRGSWKSLLLYNQELLRDTLK